MPGTRPGTDELLEMYRRMVRIRFFENTAWKGHTEIPGVIHTSVGMEASVVGPCMALRDDDYMVGTHRSHGHPIGKGARIDRLFAELMGKATGINQGKGGSMHLSDFSVGSLGETSIVGSGLPVATGAALGAKMQGLDRVALCFFGDGAAAEGTFHESLNLAAIWKLPVIYLCENNEYSELMRFSDMCPIAESRPAPRVQHARHSGRRSGRRRGVRRGKRSGAPGPSRWRPEPGRDQNLPLQCPRRRPRRFERLVSTTYRRPRSSSGEPIATRSSCSTSGSCRRGGYRGELAKLDDAERGRDRCRLAIRSGQPFPRARRGLRPSVHQPDPDRPSKRRR